MHSGNKKPVDFDRMYRCIADEPTIRPIISSYRLHLEVQLRQLQAALDDNECQEVHRIAHAIKGGALNIGASELTTAALAMERQARSGDMAAARLHIADVVHAAERVSSYILQRYKE